ncbi:MAG: EAL domain-containing protein [Planctomycetes bacterium]|nr:EAL domain-containing protein [Planctomycetota bacterium]
MHDATHATLVLVAEDDATLLSALARALRHDGHEVVCAPDGARAAKAIDDHDFDVVLSDIAMPGLEGTELLAYVRARDPDLPVILMTGAPSVSTAVTAVERGALRYLIKPIAIEELRALVRHAVGIRGMARIRRRLVESATRDGAGGADLAADHARFQDCLNSLSVAFQPIVAWRERKVVAHEALLRSNTSALPDPGAVLAAAERLGRLGELGARVRELAATPWCEGRAFGLLYVNLHPRDLFDDALLDRTTPLATIADRVVLEVTERASLDGLGDLRGRIAALRFLGYRIALDDLGAGYSGLANLVLLAPEVVKLDRSLVSDVDREPSKQALVRSMVGAAREMCMTLVAECIERVGERDALDAASRDARDGHTHCATVMRPGLRSSA